MTTDPIIPAYTLTPGRLREAPLGTVVADRDGDLWLRSTMTVTHPDTATFDDLDAFVGRQVLGWGIWACSGRPMVGPVYLRSSASLARVFGDPRGKLRPSTVAEKSLVRSMSPRELVSNMYLGEPEVDDEVDDEYHDAPADLDPDAVAERALDRARCVLTGDGEHVEVTITRDADGKVRVRTAVTGEVES